jgi:hypothetical protein
LNSLKVQEFKGSRVQRFKSSKVQEFKSSRRKRFNAEHAEGTEYAEKREPRWRGEPRRYKPKKKTAGLADSPCATGVMHCGEWAGGGDWGGVVGFKVR